MDIFEEMDQGGFFLMVIGCIIKNVAHVTETLRMGTYSLLKICSHCKRSKSIIKTKITVTQMHCSQVKLSHIAFSKDHISSARKNQSSLLPVTRFRANPQSGKQILLRQHGNGN